MLTIEFLDLMSMTFTSFAASSLGGRGGFVALLVVTSGFLSSIFGGVDEVDSKIEAIDSLTITEYR